MIVKQFNINDLDLNYFVGINQISIDLKKFQDLNNLKNKTEALDFIFNLIENIQKNYKGSTLQFFSNKYVLNQDHIFTACYYIQRAFLNDVNISKRKNIELFLYLVAKRQIKYGIEAFGIKATDLSSGKMSYCIISSENNLEKINEEILHNLKAKEIKIDLNDKSVERYNTIKNFFGISDDQINIVLKSYGIKNISNNQIIDNLDYLFLAIHDLICEKMSLLSLEKI